MPAVSPSATDCFRRASSASRPALVKPSVVGSATAPCGHAGSAAAVVAARVVDDLAVVVAGVCACAVTASAAIAAIQSLMLRSSMFTCTPPGDCRARGGKDSLLKHRTSAGVGTPDLR